MHDLSQLAGRIQQLEDVAAIARITARYAHAVDKGWNGKSIDVAALADVFTLDATWTSAAQQVDVAGRDAIIAMLESSTAAVEFAMHSFTNPVITVTDATATATWLLWVGVRAGERTNHVYQSEDLTYARTTAGWRISSISLHFGQMLLPSA